MKGTEIQRQYEISNNVRHRLTKEGDCFPPVKKTMVIRESDNHYWSNNNLAVHDNRLLFDSVHTEHGGLWEVNNWSAVEGTEDATVGAKCLWLVRCTVRWRNRPTW